MPKRPLQPPGALVRIETEHEEEEGNLVIDGNRFGKIPAKECFQCLNMGDISLHDLIAALVDLLVVLIKLGGYARPCTPFRPELPVPIALCLTEPKFLGVRIEEDDIDSIHCVILVIV